MLLVADLEDEMKKKQVGRVQEKWKILVYADDLIILVKNEEGMKEIMKRIEKYLKKKSYNWIQINKKWSVLRGEEVERKRLSGSEKVKE